MFSAGCDGGDPVFPFAPDGAIIDGGVTDVIPTDATPDGAIAPDADASSDAGGDNPLIDRPPAPSEPFSGRDLDEDGIPDQLEMEGFMWDATTREFARWNLDPGTRRYFTDPDRVSTAGDPYSDAMEVSGIGMDPTVSASEDEPLVPAAPRITAVVTRYTIQMLEELQISTGGSIESSESWNVKTAEEYSSTKENSTALEVGVSVGAEAGFPVVSVDTELSVSQQTTSSRSYTESESTAFGSGGGVASTQDWSRTTTVNSGEVATMSFTVDFTNLGNAASTEIVPTFVLLVGGVPIDTFESDITIDPLDGGQQLRDNVHDVTLSLNELQRLESGAPITLRMSQARHMVSRIFEGGFATYYQLERRDGLELGRVCPGDRGRR